MKKKKRQQQDHLCCHGQTDSYIPPPASGKDSNLYLYTVALWIGYHAYYPLPVTSLIKVGVKPTQDWNVSALPVEATLCR